MNRFKFIANGQVQGVGFRPFVFRLAVGHGLSGVVLNSPAGVEIEVQGEPAALQAFEHDLTHSLPPLARITHLHKEQIAPLANETDFKIIATQQGDPSAQAGQARQSSQPSQPSQPRQGAGLLVSPDVATCKDCLADINEAGNRRHGYSFTNCTNCGPRYTIINALPYDRPFTSLACFPMCPACKAEYHNPADRRFHAQPNACPVCGPQIWLQEPDGQKPPVKVASGELKGQPDGHFGSAGQNTQSEASALRMAARKLLAGKIVAIKGLGGFHLACYACDAQAVARLRQRKQRPHKPLAIMVPNLEVAARLVHLSEAEKEALSSSAAPIVLARKREQDPNPILPKTGETNANVTDNIAPNINPNRTPSIAQNLAPGSRTLGLMLPYTPEQHLLLQHLAAELAAELDLGQKQFTPLSTAELLPVLVMTSGNRSSEPIAIGNREALIALHGLADVFLLHNRDILVRADDSVLQVDENDGLNILRRARGFAPQPISTELAAPKPNNKHKVHSSCALGVGAELKNTICLAETLGQHNGAIEINAFVSQHIGDVKDAASESFMRQTEAHLGQLLGLKPQIIVRDLHPDYLSSLWAEELGQEAGVPALALQHHKAHAFSVLFEHGYQGEALALTLDGSGLGDDKTIWGGELLLANTLNAQCQRLGHISPTPTPGGDMAAREPWRMAQAYLFKLGQSGAWFESELPDASHLLSQMLAKNINTPLNTSCGRLFDAVAGLLGFGRQQSPTSAANRHLPTPSGAAPYSCPAALNSPGISFEGQAAIWLENMQHNCKTTQARPSPAHFAANLAPPYPCPVLENGDLLLLNTLSLVEAVWQDISSGTPPQIIAQNFHLSLAHGLAHWAATAARLTGVSTVALSGGVMHNATLRRLLPALLRQKNLKPLLHQQLPTGDGCISFGQACWGLLQKELLGI